jgi:hypothetical protein
MTRVGIQIKPDHPVLQRRSHWDGGSLIRRSVEAAQPDLLACFAAAYGLQLGNVAEMFRRGLVQIRETDDGSVWVEFVSELTAEEGSQALNAMRRFGV